MDLGAEWKLKQQCMIKESLRANPDTCVLGTQKRNPKDGMGCVAAPHCTCSAYYFFQICSLPKGSK